MKKSKQGSQIIATSPQIRPLIPLPEEIEKAHNNNRLAVFMGAGVSRLVGCMGWGRLAANLVEQCFRTTREDGEKCINFRERETLLSESDHKKTITICHHLLKEADAKESFFEELEKALTGDPKKLGEQNIYREIVKLNGVFITTNADDHLTRFFSSDRVAITPSGFALDLVEPMKVYHVHGSTRDRDSLVFTVNRYLRRYRESWLRGFLRTIFQEYTVLFLGYGMSEFELLDFLVTKHGMDEDGEMTLQHFIVKGYYAGEDNILDFDRRYFEDLGIRVLGYAKDEKGFDQLLDIVRHWNQELRSTSIYLSQAFDKVKDAAKRYDPATGSQILQLISQEKPLEDEFFKSLAGSPDPKGWLQPLLDAGYLNPKHNPQPAPSENADGLYSMPRWNVLGFMENLAKANAKKPRKEHTDLLRQFVISVLDHRLDSGQRVENVHTDAALVRIAYLLPKREFDELHMRLVSATLRSRWSVNQIPLLIADHVVPALVIAKRCDLLVPVLEQAFGFRGVDCEKHAVEPLIEAYWLEKLLSKRAPAIGCLCAAEAATAAVAIIRLLLDEDERIFRHFRSVSSTGVRGDLYHDNYEALLLRLAREMLAAAGTRKIRPLVASMLGDSHLILRKLAINAIDAHYRQLNGLFWNRKGNLLDEECRTEIFEYLEHHASELTESQLARVLRWVEEKEYPISVDSQEDPERHGEILAYRKKEWLFPIRDSKSAAVRHAYLDCHELNPQDVEHPGLAGFVQVRSGEISPITERELGSMDNEAVAQYLLGFKQKSGWDEPRRGGLASTLRSLITANPRKFSDEPTPFLRSPVYYQYHILLGLQAAWKAKVEFDWATVLDYLTDLAKKLSASAPFSDERSDNYELFTIGQIAQLIEEGVREDSHAFEPQLTAIAEQIIYLLFDITPATMSGTTDLLLTAINSPFGHVCSALLEVTLRIARVEKPETTVRWKKETKELLDDRLQSGTRPLELSFRLGQYLGNLMYLDGAWVGDNIALLFPDDQDHWSAAMSGYVYHSSRLYGTIYSLLKEHGHYHRALQTEFADSFLGERIVQHGCVAYLNDFEDLDDDNGVLRAVVEAGDGKSLGTVIWWMWTQRRNVDDNQRVRIRRLWALLVQKLRPQVEGDRGKAVVAADLSDWLAFFDVIDDEIQEWLLFAMSSFPKSSRRSNFVTTLRERVAGNAAAVGNIFHELVSHGDPPTYPQEAIREVVEGLYVAGEKEWGNRICNTYFLAGHQFLRDIFDKFN